MPKLTSGLTQKERLEVLRSIDCVLTGNKTHEQQVLRAYRDRVVRECHEDSGRVYGLALSA
ncbi:MAG: hypothetical protein P8101_14890 [Candidatus Thiodiazotropha sp.]|jgi:hypothetical protein